MVEAPIFQGVIKLRNVLDCQAKILEAVMDQRQSGSRLHNIHNIEIVSLLPSGSFEVISLALPRVSKRLTMGRSAEGQIKARLPI